MTARLRLFLFAVATVISLNICVATGQIEHAGYLFSPSLPYRMQTDAFLRGHLDLSENPADTKFDMAWSEGGVQQVWGLGVPLWRLPFEILARAVGQPAFPDRVCLAVFIALVTYVVLCTFTVDDSVHEPGDWLCGILRNPLGIASVIILIAFPPIIMLCRGAFNVYEEAVVYSYYYAIALFAASVDFARAKNVALSDDRCAGGAGWIYAAN